MILCIEDSRAYSTLLHGMLRIITERALIFVPSRKEAINALSLMISPPALIFCDLLMEDNGKSLILLVREKYPAVPIIVVTEATDLAGLLESGVHAIVSKSEPGLASRLNNYLADFGLSRER